MTECQHVASARPLVDTDEEQAVLEALLDEAKPRLPPGPVFAKLHDLLYTPFRYPPLRHGSRFGARHEQGLWYGSEELRTALAEAAYYRILLFEGTAAELAPHTLPLSAFQARVRTAAAIDLSRPPFARYAARLCSPTRYRESQALGARMRAAGIAAVRYPSARDPAHGLNLGLFTPAAFAHPRPLRAPETWLCTVTAAHDVDFRHQRAAGVDAAGFERRAFLVGGELPSPAV